MAIRIEQLPIDFGDEVKRLFNRFYPLLIERAWVDAADVLGVELAFDLDNPFVQEVLDQLAAQIVGIVDTTRDEIQALIGKQAEEGWSIDELADKIAELADIHSTERARLIARTETAAAYSKGSLLAYAESGVVSGVEWLLGPNSCDVCKPLAGIVVGLDEEFAAGIKHPPAHPNCTCSLSPVVGS